MSKKPHDFRDLPEPPRRSQDNYASALAEVYRALNEAELVAPGDSERDWVGEAAEMVRAELLNQIESEEDSDE